MTKIPMSLQQCRCLPCPAPLRRRPRPPLPRRSPLLRSRCSGGRRSGGEARCCASRCSGGSRSGGEAGRSRSGCTRRRSGGETHRRSGDARAGDSPAKPAAAPTAAASGGEASGRACGGSPAAKPAAAPRRLLRRLPPLSPRRPAVAATVEGARGLHEGLRGLVEVRHKFSRDAFGPGSPEVAAKSTVKFKKDMGGFFYRGDLRGQEAEGRADAVQGHLLHGLRSGLAAAARRRHRQHGRPRLEHRQDAGDTATYTGEQYTMGAKVKTRETMGMKGRKASTSSRWTWAKASSLIGEETCKK